MHGRIKLVFLAAISIILWPLAVWAAFPTVQTTSNGQSTTGTTHNLTLPSGIQSGDLLLMFIDDAFGTATHSFPAGWTQLWSTATGSTMRGTGAFRRADGTEGSTVTVTTSTSVGIDYIGYRITGHHASTDPEGGTPATGAGTTPNPPALTPSWGAEDTLWIAVFHHDSNVSITSPPTDYTNSLVSGGSGGGSTGAARRELNATSDDPGTFTVSISDDWIAQLVAIRPAAGGGGSVLPTGTLILLGVGK